ncbi:MAG TPA: tRNA uridine-5-carboxymethylaminomethyl(34) synthesis GTPase MnmE [Gemmatimonadales bacterium]|nr:tRNA uridine-5-carboxymethylaminomethyl(34) synthesis GTPase MnmE [Gemmatimonadales bacterium]
MLHDPIVALATPPGRGALALIRLSGRGAYDVAARCLTPFHPDPARTVFRARLAHPATGEPIDDVLAVCFPAPRSYTGDDAVEISTHGGLAAPAAALAALAAAGARQATPGEFTRRAVRNGKMDLLQAEATADLIDAGAPAQRRRALQQLDRGLSGRLAALRDAILTLEALISYEIDFPEEDEGPVDPARLEGAWRAARDGVAGLLATAPDGERLRDGALLVIAGPPNAGKSSLFNALLGTERALVTEIPGTTRDAIEAHAVIDGFPFRLVDTAGLRTAAERVESLGIEVARRYLGAADLVLYCEETGDAGAATGAPAARDAFLAGLAAPVVEVRTKADLGGPSVSSVVSVSSLTGAGLAELRRALAEAAFGHLVALGDVEPVVTRARHRVALERARDELDAFAAARAAGIDAAVAATHLRDAVAALDELIGAVTPDDVLDRVFASFCVGK